MIVDVATKAKIKNSLNTSDPHRESDDANSASPVLLLVQIQIASCIGDVSSGSALLNSAWCHL